ncbi:MAG TPA: hypothetical protein VM778_04330 [Gemmatimonadota bacterium]|nr:hypothetical protein [Gemmatimonadota bacterium]
MARSRIAAVLVGLAAAVALAVFALYNAGQPVVLRFGLLTWRGEAVYAVYAGVFAGLLTMFLAGLPADLAARRERARLERGPQPTGATTATVAGEDGPATERRAAS